MAGFYYKMAPIMYFTKKNCTIILSVNKGKRIIRSGKDKFIVKGGIK